MDLWALRALVLDMNFETHGVPILIRPAIGDPVLTTGIWSTPNAFDAPSSGELRRTARRRVLCVKRINGANCAIGTEVDAAESPGDVEVTWTVDGIDGEEADRIYLILARDREVTT